MCVYVCVMQFAGAEESCSVVSSILCDLKVKKAIYSSTGSLHNFMWSNRVFIISGTI